MKKFLLGVLAIFLCLALFGCAEPEKLSLPFPVEQVKSLRLSGEKTAEITVNDPESIHLVYTQVKGIPVEKKEVKPTPDAPMYRFIFYLEDGTSYRVVYFADGVKTGRIQTTGNPEKIFTSADVGGIWESLYRTLTEDAPQTGENVIPVP